MQWLQLLMPTVWRWPGHSIGRCWLDGGNIGRPVGIWVITGGDWRSGLTAHGHPLKFSLVLMGRMVVVGVHGKQTGGHVLVLYDETTVSISSMVPGQDCC